MSLTHLWRCAQPSASLERLWLCSCAKFACVGCAVCLIHYPLGVRAGGGAPGPCKGYGGAPPRGGCARVGTKVACV